MAVSLSQILEILETHAPLYLAAPWDNVGLLVESAPSESIVKTALMTIDLTEAVMREAIRVEAQLIVSYHPVMFGGIKALTQSNPNTRILLDAIRHNMTVFSPHTALDAVPGGVTDWLVEAVGPVHAIESLEPHATALAPAGMGRRGTLKKPTALGECIKRCKAHLSLDAIRVALAEKHAHGQPIETLAVCPGAGGSLLSHLTDVDLVITGEMRHHDVLALNAQGISVFLTDHTNCERGFLSLYRGQLMNQTGNQIQWHIAEEDADPLEIH
jgi:dinuclear metal center YbgI/SA1388 family protein